MRTRTTTALTAAALLALAGCSGDTDPSDEGKKPTTASEEATAAKDDGSADLKASVRAYTKALFSGDGATGYALLSERCKKEMTAAQFQAMSEQGHNDYGPLEIKNIKVDQISGDLARVSYGVGVPQFERKSQPWAREDGTWRWDAC